MWHAVDETFDLLKSAHWYLLFSFPQQTTCEKNTYKFIGLLSKQVLGLKQD